MVLTGGAAKSAAVRQIAPAIFGLPVAVPEAAEYVALGAARQAAWALSGAPEPPSWPPQPTVTYEAAATPRCASGTRRCATTRRPGSSRLSHARVERTRVPV